MSSRSTQIIGGSDREHAYVDSATNALLVKVVNPSGGGGSSVQYNEDTAHASGDTGTLALVVRNDAGTNLVSTDGDYAPLQVDSTGALRVTGGGGGTQYQEDAAHASGNTGTLALVVRNDTPGSLTSTDGDYAALQVDNTGRLRVSVDASVALTAAVSNFPATQAVSDGGGSLTVDGSVAVSNFPATQTVDDGGLSLTVDGTVAVSGTVAVTQSGTWTIDVGNFPATTTVVQATHDNLNANANIQIGNVDVGVANPVPVSDNGGSLTVDGTVAISGTVPVSDAGGSLTVDGTVAATQSGAWSVTVVDGGGSITVDGTVAISGTVAVTQSGTWAVNAEVYTAGSAVAFLNPLAVNVTNANLGLPGTTAAALGKAEDAAHTTGDVGVMMLAVRNDAVAALAGTTGDYIPLGTDAVGALHVNVRTGVIATVSTVTTVSSVSAVIAGTGATNLGKAEDAAHSTGATGVMALAVRNDTPAALAGTTLDYIPITTDSLGRVWANVNEITPGTAAANLGKAEDAAHTSGDVGVMSLAVRQDTLAALSGTTGDYTPFSVDSLGRLYVREAGVTTIALSGSTRGRPIQITATASTGTTLHTATTTSGQLDRIFIYLTNTSTAAVTVTIEFGTTGAGNEMDIIVPANETILAVDGAVIGGAATDTITAYATTGSVINAFGRVERLT